MNIFIRFVSLFVFALAVPVEPDFVAHSFSQHAIVSAHLQTRASSIDSLPTLSIFQIAALFLQAAVFKGSDFALMCLYARLQKVYPVSDEALCSALNGFSPAEQNTVMNDPGSDAAWAIAEKSSNDVKVFCMQEAVSIATQSMSINKMKIALIGGWTASFLAFACMHYLYHPQTESASESAAVALLQQTANLCAIDDVVKYSACLLNVSNPLFLQKQMIAVSGNQAQALLTGSKSDWNVSTADTYIMIVVRYLVDNVPLLFSILLSNNCANARQFGLPCVETSKDGVRSLIDNVNLLSEATANGNRKNQHDTDTASDTQTPTNSQTSSASTTDATQSQALTHSNGVTASGTGSVESTATKSASKDNTATISQSGSPKSATMDSTKTQSNTYTVTQSQATASGTGTSSASSSASGTGSLMHARMQKSLSISWTNTIANDPYLVPLVILQALKLSGSMFVNAAEGNAFAIAMNGYMNGPSTYCFGALSCAGMTQCVQLNMLGMGMCVITGCQTNANCLSGKVCLQNNGINICILEGAIPFPSLADCNANNACGSAKCNAFIVGAFGLGSCFAVGTPSASITKSIGN